MDHEVRNHDLSVLDWSFPEKEVASVDASKLNTHEFVSPILKKR